ncbi:response regulator [Pseudoduganella sp. S-14]|jgi:signal transduction histidine kinase|uniref:ATP-binding response regulator n=1 Tax=Pseudoduganella sp. S-14 TaxID=3404065 RepID=UPI003CEB6E8B
MNRVRVLIVEDDIVDRIACRRAFAQAPGFNCELLEAESGQEGLDIALREEPDCILLDYHLPDLTGLEFLARLAADRGEPQPNIPVMMLTGADSATVAAEAMRRGARDYLVKDSDGRYLDFLAGAIDRLLREQRLIDEKQLAEQVLRQSQKELRELAAYQEKLKEHERTRIAQEIHDELGGLLTGIKAYISVAIERGGEQSDPLLKDAAKLAQDAIETVRRVITDLRPSVLDQLGIWPALEWYAEQVAQRSGLQCSCNITPKAQALELDAERSTMLFRVAQEALTNVVRHAEASEARVIVDTDGENVVLRVEDNGKGIESAGLSDRESWGLFGMHERTRRFAGELNISGKAGQGTTLHLRLPLEDKNG